MAADVRIVIEELTFVCVPCKREDEEGNSWWRRGFLSDRHRERLRRCSCGTKG